MRTSTLVAFAALAALATACGTPNDKNKTPGAPAPEAQLTDEQRAELDQQFATLPQAAIVRVPLDADGNPSGEPEMRVAATALGQSESAAVEAFESGKAPERLIASADELDQDTSTQSWTSWGVAPYDPYTPYSVPGNNHGAYPGAGHNPKRPPVYAPYPRAPGYVPSYPGTGGPGYGKDYWFDSYKPVLYWQGKGWNYNIWQPYYVKKSGYAYYCYTPTKHW